MFVDFQNQSMIPVIYYMSDVFVLPSKGPNETWGLAVNEAMACGKPVVTTNKVGCAVDLIKNGKNGIVITPGDYKTALLYIEDIYAEKEEVAETSLSINRRILSVYSFDSMISSITLLLSQLNGKMSK